MKDNFTLFVQALDSQIGDMRPDHSNTVVLRMVRNAAQNVLRSNKSPVEWRCFHCDQVFTNKDDARIHFGASVSRDPACQIDAAKYRDMEDALRRYIDKEETNG